MHAVARVERVDFVGQPHEQILAVAHVLARLEEAKLMAGHDPTPDMRVSLHHRDNIPKLGSWCVRGQVDADQHAARREDRCPRRKHLVNEGTRRTYAEEHYERRAAPSPQLLDSQSSGRCHGNAIVVDQARDSVGFHA